MYFPFVSSHNFENSLESPDLAFDFCHSAFHFCVFALVGLPTSGRLSPIYGWVFVFGTYWLLTSMFLFRFVLGLFCFVCRCVLVEFCYCRFISVILMSIGEFRLVDSSGAMFVSFGSPISFIAGSTSHPVILTVMVFVLLSCYCFRPSVVPCLLPFVLICFLTVIVHSLAMVWMVHVVDSVRPLIIM